MSHLVRQINCSFGRLYRPCPRLDAGKLTGKYGSLGDAAMSVTKLCFNFRNKLSKFFALGTTR